MSAEGKPALPLEGYSLFIEIIKVFCIFPLHILFQFKTKVHTQQRNSVKTAGSGGALTLTSSEVMRLSEYGSCVSSIYLLCLLISLEMQEFEGENSLWMVFKEAGNGNPLVVQWLGLSAFMPWTRFSL